MCYLIAFFTKDCVLKDREKENIKQETNILLLIVYFTNYKLTYRCRN